MANSLFDPSWHRVADLIPRIRSHAEFHRHHYRGERWYILQDHTSERFHRFAPSAYKVIGLMNGQRSMQEIWDSLVDSDDPNILTQPELIRLLGQLHGADVLMSDVPPDTEELLARYLKRKRSTRWQKLKTPLAIRIPLLDPERFLQATIGFVRPLFGPMGALLWCSVVLTAGILMLEHWPELTENVTEKALTPQNLLFLWLTFPVIKALHEFGHAYATKTWGGEVHEMGVMLLVLMPIPYVDASAASAFGAKHRRIVVGAAGILVELFLASLALFVWLSVEPGFVRTIAYNTMLIAGVSTVLFNGNPLLRFDGYYIFADILEIPNLAARSNKYILYLLQKYGFGLTDSESPVLNPSEKPWFVFFAIASFVYRMFIYFVIILFVAGKYFFIGVLLALWAATNMLIWPVMKGLWFVFAGSSVRVQRARAIAVSMLSIAVLTGLLTALPLPYFSRAEGVVWIADESIVRAGTAGFVTELFGTSGQRVDAGDALLRLNDPSLVARIAVVKAQVEAAVARRKALETDDIAKAQIADEEVERLQGRLKTLEERAEELVVYAKRAGVLHIPKESDLLGRYFNQGAEMAYVIEQSSPTIRVAIKQDRIDLIRQQRHDVEIRLAEQLDKPLNASVKREVPAATDQLPSAALSMLGGGEIAADPSAPDGARALENIFLIDLHVEESIELLRLGGRAYVRFDHGATPLAQRWYREIRQLLLGRFDV